MSEELAVRKPEPVVQSIAVADIVDALAAGLRDFRAAPFYGLFFGGIYALGGIVILLTAAVLHLPYLSYPLAIGFALIGPFIAVGLYEVSRRLERGQPLNWSGVLGVVVDQHRRELGWMAFVTMFALLMWMYQVRILLALFLGIRLPPTIEGFITVVFTTPEGWMFLLVGHIIGALLSVILFSLTVVSFPLLLDREVDFITAMITSVRSVIRNPKPMLGWALVVVVLLMLATAPSFIGLLIVLPVLGHTTWHLYRKLIAPEAA